jgi:2-polyprenyl-3-methyl-5-hydroxy-6-metoxy-1,4-benzoquinol methylase
MSKRVFTVHEYYQSTVDHYADQYSPSYLGYPANLKRLDTLVRRARELKVKTLLDCGCGEGTPISRLHEEAGVDVWGFDFSEKMARTAQAKLEAQGLRGRVWTGDITQTFSFAPEGIERPEAFDATLAAGVFPHLTEQQEAAALKNMASAVRPGGRVFVEFRNELFALFTLNRFSYELFAEKLIPRRAAEEAGAELKKFFHTDLPVDRPSPAGAPSSIDGIFCKFKNPFECPALFKAAGLRIEAFHFYHFHALPPMMEQQFPQLFRAASLEMEKDPNDWKGHFMASAFVVESCKE